MSSKLEKLLALYEAERTSLTAEMQECVAHMDYSRAHLFSKALGRVNQQLRTLFNILDKWHDEKEHLARWIKSFEERAATEEGHKLRYLTEKIDEKKKKLAELPSASAQKVLAGHSLRATLSSLLAREITGCTLVFQESQRLSCHFRLVRKTLILTVPQVRRHRASYTLEKRHIEYFRSLGFRLYDNKDKLMLFAPYATLEDVNAIQHILARITFDVLSFKGIAGESFIKYHP
jgi:hypothetical protein